MHRCRTMLDKDLINTGIYESTGKQSLPLVQLVQQLLRYCIYFLHSPTLQCISLSLPAKRFVFKYYRNIASQTIGRLKDVARRISNYIEAEHVSKERSASLDLLLRFQRLLVSKLYLGVNSTEDINGYGKRLCYVQTIFLLHHICFSVFFVLFFADPELLGVGSLLKKYIALLCTHIGDILPVATSIASTGHRHFAEVSRVIEGDLTGRFPPSVFLQYVYL